jgi:hypothetical protein
MKVILSVTMEVNPDVPLTPQTMAAYNECKVTIKREVEDFLNSMEDVTGDNVTVESISIVDAA